MREVQEEMGIGCSDVGELENDGGRWERNWGKRVQIQKG